MNIEKMREEFEVAIVKMHTDTGVPECDALTFLEEGINGYLSVAWWAWQKSRTAIEVELPVVTVSMFATSRDARAAKEGLDMARRAITDAGLKVKP